jgi:hypothetical protein
MCAWAWNALLYQLRKSLLRQHFQVYRSCGFRASGPYREPCLSLKGFEKARLPLVPNDTRVLNERLLLIGKDQVVVARFVAQFVAWKGRGDRSLDSLTREEKFSSKLKRCPTALNRTTLRDNFINGAPTTHRQNFARCSLERIE